MAMKQSEAVYQAVVKVLGGEENITGPVSLDKSQKEMVYQMLVDGFINGDIEYKKEASPETIKKYVPGLVNNWLRKDKRLNGGVKYEPKNPGSRAGAGDDTMKALKALLSITTDPNDRAKIEQEMEKRRLELKPKMEINVSALPEHLRNLVPSEFARTEQSESSSEEESSSEMAFESNEESATA